MKSPRLSTIAASLLMAMLAFDSAIPAQDTQSLKVPGGLAFSEFKGYEGWGNDLDQPERPLHRSDPREPGDDRGLQARHTRKRQAFSDGARIARISWVPKKQEAQFGQPQVPGALSNVGFMVKDSTRFADGGGWGYALFQYDTASQTFRAATTEDKPPQSNDATCGVACHTTVKAKDFVFTDYARR